MSNEGRRWGAARSTAVSDLYPDPSAGAIEGGADARQAVLKRAAEAAELRSVVWQSHGEALVRAAHLLAGAFKGGGKLLAFGNGGSATQAQDMVLDLVEPPVPGWHALPALCIQEPGAITGLAAELGFENVFSHQILRHGSPDDVAVAFSSGPPDANVFEAFRAAREREMSTLAFVGGESWGVGSSAPDQEVLVDGLVPVPSSDTGRVQEVHATACHTLLYLVQRIIRGAASPARRPPRG